MKLQRRQFLQLATSAATLPVMPIIARGQTYPVKPVRIIVNLAPITARSRYDSNFIITLSICERFRAQFLSPGPKSLRQLFALPRATKNESEFSIPQYFARL